MKRDDKDKDTEMTYLRNGFECLTTDETKVYEAIKQLFTERRTGNNSQIASYTHLSRTRVGEITTELHMRGFIANTSKCSAYHWKVTRQPVPYSVADRTARMELQRRQAELNQKIRHPQANVIDEQARLGGAGRETVDNTVTMPVPDQPTKWTVTTFDGQRRVATGTFDDEATARQIASGHREAGFTTRVRPAGLSQADCCDSCS